MPSLQDTVDAAALVTRCRSGLSSALLPLLTSESQDQSSDFGRGKWESCERALSHMHVVRSGRVLCND